MRSCWASIWFLSMSILTSLTAPLASLTTFSIIGCSVLHGPHHGAQKSTITGTVREASITSLANLVWSLSLMRSAGAACGAAPVSIVSMCPRMGNFGSSAMWPPSPHDARGGSSGTQANSLPAPTPLFTAPGAVCCRVYTAFLHYLWTPECNKFCPETCPESRCKPVARADVRRRRCLLFGSQMLVDGMVRTMPGAALSEELLGHAGGSPGGTDALWLPSFETPRYARLLRMRKSNLTLRRRGAPSRRVGNTGLLVELVLLVPVVLLEVAIEVVLGDAIGLHRYREVPGEA